MNSCLFRNSRAESRACYLLSAGLSSVACNTPFSPRIPPCIRPLSITTAARSQARKSRRCLLLKLIGFSALERAVRRTPRCRPFFGLAGRPTLINFNRRQPVENTASLTTASCPQIRKPPHRIVIPTPLAIPTPTTPFSHSSRHSHTPLVIPTPTTPSPKSSRHSRTHHSIPTIITSFPRRREPTPFPHPPHYSHTYPRHSRLRGNDGACVRRAGVRPRASCQ